MLIKGADLTEWIAVRIGSSRFAQDEAQISNLLISCAYVVQSKLLDISISMVTHVRFHEV